MTKLSTARQPFTQAPYIGQPVTIRGIECRIVNILPYGTVEVSSLDDRKHYRVSGLNLLAVQPV